EETPRARCGERAKPLRKAKRRRKITAGHPAVGVGVRALDVEQNKVDRREERLVGAIAKKSGGLNRRVQAHRLRALENPAGKGELHHRLAPRNSQTAAKLDQGRRKAAEPLKHLLERDIGAVLQMPRIRV